MKIAARAAAAALTLVSVVPAAIVVAAPSDAHACGMSIMLDRTPRRPTPVQEIARAEKALEGGNHVEASRIVLATFPRIRNATAGSNALETRAMRVFALALVRTDGKADEKKVHVRAAGEWTPESNLAWAVQALREVNGHRLNDPTVQADLGEALAKTATGKDEARRILQGLAQKDLMGSPNAYAALAKLRSESGDLDGAEAAIKKCEEMSKSKSVCHPVAHDDAPAQPAAHAKPSVATRA